MTEEEKRELEFLLMELTEGELSSEQGDVLMEMIRQYSGRSNSTLALSDAHYALVGTGVLGDIGMSGAPRRIIPIASVTLNHWSWLPVSHSLD